ncbi:MAG: hypothetical protein LBP21_06580 [Synergistaceae bacterium]|jgi:hypothetical protein|nr:hypothetical protein [Synergistaceae bacterium]
MEITEKNSIKTAYEHVSIILFFVWLVGGTFMFSGLNPLISIILGMLGVNTPWIYLFLGTLADKRWIFYALGIDPIDPQIPVAASITFPPEMCLRVPLMIASFPKIASSLSGGLYLLMIISTVWAVNHIFVRMLGMYLYLDSQIKDNKHNETIAAEGFLYERLLKWGHGGNVCLRIGAMLMFVFVFVLLTFAQAPFSMVLLLFGFVVWVNFIVLAISLSKRFIVSHILLYTCSKINAHTRKEFEEMISSLISRQLKSMKLEVIPLFFIYVLTGILIYKSV